MSFKQKIPIAIVIRVCVSAPIDIPIIYLRSFCSNVEIDQRFVYFCQLRLKKKVPNPTDDFVIPIAFQRMGVSDIVCV